MPVFAVGGWYDNYVESDLDAFASLHKLAGRSDGRHRIMIGPWAHNMSIPFAGVSFGIDSSAPIRSYQIEWFDHWLKGEPDEATTLHAGNVARDARRSRRGAGAHFRHGRESLAGRAGVAAGARTLYAAVPGEPARRQQPGRRRGAGMETARRPARATSSLTIRAILFRRAAARCAAIPRSSLGDPWTSGRWKSARMCWCIPARR